MQHYSMNLTLKVWRQNGPQEAGNFETHQVKDISSEMSFLEMMDVLNEQLIGAGKVPVAFDHDCREGICGMCSMHINVKPWRASAFPVIKDLVVDRSSFDRIQQAGGYISVNTGNAQDGNSLPINKDNADAAFMAAACIGCGACVAACKNSSAMLFTSAKVSQFALLPQGETERKNRVVNMVAQMDKEGFGSCTNTGACEAVCPKGISISNIARLNREYLSASLG
jgi:succinate dehydrogenase / fumarate reductase, iron-sulfur subunit